MLVKCPFVITYYYKRVISSNSRYERNQLIRHFHEVNIFYWIQFWKGQKNLHNCAWRPRLYFVIYYTNRDSNRASRFFLAIIVMVKSLLFFIIIAFTDICLNIKRFSTKMEIRNKNFSYTSKLVRRGITFFLQLGELFRCKRYKRKGIIQSIQIKFGGNGGTRNFGGIGALFCMMRFHVNFNSILQLSYQNCF